MKGVCIIIILVIMVIKRKWLMNNSNESYWKLKNNEK